MHTTREISPTVFADARSRGLSAVAARILAGRLSEATRLDAVIAPQLANIPPPSKLQDADRAIARLARAVTDHESIGVLTDYDADGLTSHAVLTHALVRFGVAEDRISHWIGHRLEDGYGISGTLVDRLLESGDQPTVVISADCGSSDEPHIARLKAAGIDVIVTDHHRVSDAGPPVSAYAVVNPNRDDCEYPDQAIAGCMVSWLVMSGLRQALIAQGVLGESCPKLGDLLDYVALGTVADCVCLWVTAKSTVPWSTRGFSTSKHGVGRAGMWQQPTSHVQIVTSPVSGWRFSWHRASTRGDGLITRCSVLNFYGPTAVQMPSLHFCSLMRITKHDARWKRRWLRQRSRLRGAVVWQAHM